MWLQIASLIGIPSIISGIALAFFSKAQRKRDRRQEEIARQNREMEQQNRAIMAGVQALLRDRLLQGYRHYADKGWADYDVRQNMENIYLQYHGLGQNGIMDQMREEFLRLPMQRKDDESEVQ